MKIQWNEREFKRLMEDEVQSTVDDMAAEYTRDLKALTTRYTGRPVEEIKPALRRIFQQHDGDLTDPELSEYAAQIHAGGEIVFTADKVRF
ncbi:hypothetical protein [Leucobacter celer]|uniref:hypothetical protein n=1 Tax=Leucobacter celer TaxID=668625 RepID=UPI0006A7B136|nr:hypothetical protein [Leucobacter celer]